MKRILITGVGGQGTLLTSRVLGKVAQFSGLDVKVSEVHGMSQRGGSVVTYVSMGEKVYSPLIEKGGADYMLSFEQLEALRHVEYMKAGGTVVVNTQKIVSMPVITGAAAYPENILGQLESRQISVHPVDALVLAMKAGTARAVNTVMMGCLARRMEGDKTLWLEAVVACVPPKTQEINEKAFLLGWEQT